MQEEKYALAQQKATEKEKGWLLKGLNDKPSVSEVKKQTITYENTIHEMIEKDGVTTVRIKMKPEYQYQINTTLSLYDREHYRWDTFEYKNQDQVEVAKKVRAWNPDMDRGLFLFGNVGLGKTHMLKALINQHASDSQRFIFVDSVELMRNLRNFERADEFTEKYVNVFGLVIDDIARISATDFQQENLWYIFNKRQQKGKFSFISCDVPIASLRDRFSESIIDRIIGFAMPIHVKGKADQSRRKKDCLESLRQLEEASKLVDLKQLAEEDITNLIRGSFGE